MVAFAALFAAALFTAAADHPSSARLLNLQELVTANDYPRVALVNGQQGSVTVRVKIDRSGLVTSCKVVISSGHQALDEQTCALYRARARFEPATDRRGRPIETTYTQKMTWRLGDQPVIPAMPRQAWMTRSTVALSSSGGFVSCKAESTGVIASPQTCEILQAAITQVMGTVQSDGPITSFSISETYFYPVETAKAASPPELRDASKVGEQVSQITIEADGSVSQCKGISYSGFASPDRDACGMLRQARFEPATAGSASLTATVVMVAYVRKHSVT